MSCDDGLVMTLHPGVHRNHHPATFARYGADTGHDIPVGVEYTKALQPLLERYGTHPNLHLVLFTLDSDVFSREIAPLAGFYPAVYAGAPWWFLDNPSAIRSFQHSVTEIAGFGKLSGFIDDTRAFCSIPARHDMSRRLDAGFLAGLVAEHRLDEDEALDTPRRRWSPINPERCSSYDASRPTAHQFRRTPPASAGPTARSAADVRRQHRSGSCTWAWATSSAPTRPGTPTTRRTPASGASPPSPADPLELADALTAQDGLYTLITRGADGDTAPVLGSVSEDPSRPRHPGLARLSGRPAGPHRHADRHRGRLRPRRRRRAGRERPGRPRRPAPLCGATPGAGCDHPGPTRGRARWRRRRRKPARWPWSPATTCPTTAPPPPGWSPTSPPCVDP